MIVGILGLGLIGGSMARAYAKNGHTVYAAEKDSTILEFAQLAGVIHGQLNEDTIPCCDFILPAIYAGGSCQWLEANAHYIRRDALVIDCCGIKEQICECGFRLADQYGFTYCSHDMTKLCNLHCKFKIHSGQSIFCVPDCTCYHRGYRLQLIVFSLICFQISYVKT